MPTLPNPTPVSWGTIPEAAEALRVDPKTIRRMIARGDIHAERIGPRLIRVDMATLHGRPLQYAGDADA